MPSASKSDPFKQLADLLSPAVTALVEHLRIALLGQPTVEKLVAAYKQTEGIELSADEVKALLVVIAGISDQKKR